jgi:hypothetical protein
MHMKQGWRVGTLLADKLEPLVPGFDMTLGLGSWPATETQLAA